MRIYSIYTAIYRAEWPRVAAQTFRELTSETKHDLVMLNHMIRRVQLKGDTIHVSYKHGFRDQS